MDDSFRPAIFHPGVSTIAAALAIAEAKGASGLELLNAIIVGYEISTRIGTAVQPAHIELFHPVGTLGAFGAAGAAAALLSPTDDDKICHSLAIAATFAAGLQQTLRSAGNSKPLHGGNAASAGVRAAQAAAHGVTGADNALEGPVGFGVAMARSPSWELALEGLGQTYNITRVTHKIHACCAAQFLPIDAAILLNAEHQIDPNAIENVHVATYQQALDATGRFNPRTPYEAKFSLPYVVSHALVCGSVEVDAFAPERVNSPQLRALMQRFTLECDPEMDAVFPAKRHARVTITMKDGIQYTHMAVFRRGDPEWPLSDSDLNSKFHKLAGPVLGQERAEALLDLVWRLDTLDCLDLKLATKA